MMILLLLEFECSLDRAFLKTTNELRRIDSG